MERILTPQSVTPLLWGEKKIEFSLMRYFVFL
jgi:hypothetical protein